MVGIFFATRSWGWALAAWLLLAPGPPLAAWPAACRLALGCAWLLLAPGSFSAPAVRRNT